MAKTKIVVADFLKDLGFNEAEVAELTPKLEAKSDRLSESVMRQSDYDREMNAGKADITAKQAALDDANQRLNVELAEWATVQANGGQVTQKMRADLEKAEQRALKAQQVLTRVATDAGLDVTKVLSEVETQVTVPATTLTQQPDLTGYVKSSDLNAALGNVANMAVNLPAELMQLAIEHQSLFGKPLDTRDLVKELQTRAGTRNNQKSLDPRTIWEEQHGVVAARQTAETKRIDDLVTAAEARGREAGLSQIAIPGNTHVPGRTSAPVFKTEHKSLLERPQPGQTINAAASAFRSGKYRQGATTKT